MVKVGRSSNPRYRLGHANTWCPHKLYRLAAHRHYDDCVVAESVFHQALADVRVGTTEWFSIDDDEAIQLLETLNEEIACLPAPSY